MTTTFDVFARKEYPEPLVYVGSIDVDDGEDTAKVSLEKFGPDSEWIEMLAVPHHKIVTVFSEHEEDN